ncbi:MAG: DUF3782 domain-containing protein [Methylococcaceae bacterium]|nr:MAG: DUF3782 domain-containing protein [Methylococcaceae bacterium]
MFAETDRKFQETDRKFQETDLKFQETERLLKERSAETERYFKEKSAENERYFKERSAETDRRMKELSKNLGDIGNRLGEFVEHMVEPTVVKLFQTQGIEIHEVHSGVHVERNGEGIEVDLLVVNDGAIVAVECKSKLTEEHVNAHVRRMEKLKRMLPAYRQAFGAVAAMVVPADVAELAQQQGFYVLTQSGESVKVCNDADFRAKAW